MVRDLRPAFLLSFLTACGGTTATTGGSTPDASPADTTIPSDGSPSDSATAPDAGADSPCETTPWHVAGGDADAPWATGCPDAGCPSGTTCIHGTGPQATYPVGCAPVPASCGGNPTCACMGCVCGSATCTEVQPAGYNFECDTMTRSQRAVKDDVRYVDDEEREALARQALDIPLARYRYKEEPRDARRRLGFLIDDQPDPSPAVLADRAHVDEYGYTSMLLATVQEQAKEIDALRRRVEALERRR